MDIHDRLNYVKVALLSVVLASAAASAACGSEQKREEVAAREFHQRLEQDRADLIYASSSTFLRDQLSEPQFRLYLAQTRNLGALKETSRAQYRRTRTENGGEVVTAYYNSRFEKASCLEAFSWRVEPEGLKLATYSCAPNMQVTCLGGIGACETSPVAPSIASLP